MTLLFAFWWANFLNLNIFSSAGIILKINCNDMNIQTRTDQVYLWVMACHAVLCVLDKMDIGQGKQNDRKWGKHPHVYSIHILLTIPQRI